MFKTYKPSGAMLAAMHARVSGNPDAGSADGDCRHRSFDDGHSALARAGSAILSSPVRQPKEHTPAAASLGRSLVCVRQDEMLRPVVEGGIAPPMANSLRSGFRGPLDSHRAVPAAVHSEDTTITAPPSTAVLVATSRSEDTNAKVPRAAFMRSENTYGTPASVRSENTNAKVPRAASVRSEDKRKKVLVATVRSENKSTKAPRAPSARSEDKRKNILVAAVRSANKTMKVPVAATSLTAATASAPSVDVNAEIPIAASVHSVDRNVIVPVAATARSEDKIKLLTRALQAPYKFVAKPAPSFARCPSNYARKKVRLKETLLANRQPSGADGANQNDYAAEMEKQKLRLANKMEMVDFYAACQSRMLSMTQKHNDKLRRRLLHGDRNSENVAKSMSAIGLERELSSWQQKENTTGVTKRMKRINAFIAAQPT
eukprot:GEMP01027381.1.p1 GENE.GEMP01027381.1~~GEMP01027381.1.p1  ORF type:complete len:431 (+),score=81.07 GEMP01027381.1:152-1444(+)